MFVTGDVAGTEAERFLEEIGCRWLAKPFRLRDLLRCARGRSLALRHGRAAIGSARLVPARTHSRTSRPQPPPRRPSPSPSACASIVCWNDRMPGAAPRRVCIEQSGAERLLQALDRARVQLRHARFVDADLRADLLHRRFGVVVEADHLALARRQRRDRRADAVAHFGVFVGLVRRDAAPTARAPAAAGAVDVLAGRERRGAIRSC